VKDERGPGLYYFTLPFVYVCAVVIREWLQLYFCFVFYQQTLLHQEITHYINVLVMCRLAFL